MRPTSPRRFGIALPGTPDVKSTEKIASGEFSRIVSRMGGQDNAFTSRDATAYFQRIAKDRLAKVMEMEADRMVNLRLTEAEVLTERT